MLSAAGLVKRYGRRAALDGFWLTVRPGEITGLVGANGAGKTTFVEVVTGLVRPDAGRVTVAGVDALRDPRRARARLGVAPQETALYPAATVRAHLELFGGLAGLRRAALRAEIDRTATELALTDVLDRPVGLLSGGQRRRAQTAGALLPRPAVLLLDEPTVGADPETRAAVLSAVRARADDGAAVLYTTHYLPELTELDATVAVAAHGRIIARGTRAELLSGLPGEVRLTFAAAVPAALARLGRADGTVLTVSAPDPGRTLTALLARLTPADPPPVTVDLVRPTLDDLLAATESDTEGCAVLADVGVLVRHNVRLVRREPGPVISRLAIPLVAVLVLSPLYRAALGRAAGAGQAVTGVLVLFSLLALALVGVPIVAERGWHTWQRLRVTGVRTPALLAGKAAPALVVLLVQQVLVFGLGVTVLGLRVPAAGLLVAAGATWAVTLLCVGTALGSVVRSTAEFAAVQDVCGFLCTSLGGALVPLAAMPGWARELAPVSPAYWAMSAFHTALADQPGPLLRACAVLLALAVAAAAVTGWRMRRGWGRSALL